MLVKITVDRKTMQVLNEEIIDPEPKPDYEPLARFLAEKFIDEYRKESEVKKNVLLQSNLTKR